MSITSKVAGYKKAHGQNRPGNGLSGALECFLKGQKPAAEGELPVPMHAGDQTGSTSAGRARSRIKDIQHQFHSIDTTRHFSNVHAGEVGVLASESKVMFSVPLVLTPQDTTGCGVSGIAVKSRTCEREVGQRRIEAERARRGGGGCRGMVRLICLMGLPEGNFHAKGLDRAGISAKKRGSLEGTAP
jgi:hypothetical protein